MTIKEYLNSRYTPSTAKSYYREISIYLRAEQSAKQSTYQDIIGYIHELRKHQNPSSVHRILQSIKKYYNYLVEQGLREDNPSKYIQLKDYKKSKNLVQNRLLSRAELQFLWDHFREKKYRYPILKNRNISMMGLLLFQGLRSGEIKRLNLCDIKLEQSEIYIEKSHNARARTLSLLPCQILPFYQYLHADRPLLLLSNEKKLFINKLGKAEKGETVHYLTETVRPLLSEKKVNPKTIRMSVLSQQFKSGKSLQEVQYFAGHHYPSSTERYKMNYLQTLQEEVFKHHPLV